MNDCITRTAQPEDYPSLQQLYVDAVLGLAIQHYTAAQCAAWAALVQSNKEWDARLAALNVLLAEGTDSTLAGFLAYSDDGHIDLLFTAPSHARHGIATTLYVLAEQDLRNKRVQRLFTEASRLARPFFAKHGFAVDAEESVSRNGESLQRFVMSKLLVA